MYDRRPSVIETFNYDWVADVAEGALTKRDTILCLRLDLGLVSVMTPRYKQLR